MHWDLLAVPLLMLASFPVELLWRRMRFLSGTRINLIEDSWILDTSFKASRSLWFGRNVAFTYGPLFQWLSSAPARSRGLSIGAVYATYTLLPLWWTFLLGYLSLQLLLPEQPAWKRFLLLLLLCVFWAPWDGRTGFSVFLFVLFLRGWYGLRHGRFRPVLLGGGAALLCAMAFLYSADTGAYAIAGLLLSLAGVAWETRREPRTLRTFASALLAFAGCSLIFVVAMNAIMARPFGFRFWKNSLAILAGYRWIESSTMAREGTIHVLISLFAGGIVFLVREVTGRNRDSDITARSGFLISAFLFACVAMQSGLVRSDWIHIVLSVYPMIFFTGCVLFSFPSRTGSALAVLTAVACSSLFGEPPRLLPTIRQNYSQLTDPLTVCPPGFLEFDRVCYPGVFTHILQTTSAYLQQRSRPDDYMMVFPYENIFGIASRRSVAGGVLQSYLVSGEYLSRLDIGGLEAAAAPVGLCLPDGDHSRLIDGVPNFTRSPEVWLWTFRHYRKEDQLFHGIYGLLRDDSRAASIAMNIRPLGIPPRGYPIQTRSSVLDLGDPAWPSDGADFLRLRLTVRYSPWWRLRKPALLLLEIERSDSSHARKRFIVEPNVPSEVWFYPWDDAELAQYFDPDEKQWRLGPRPAITHLRLLVMPLDWVSIQPDMIEVQSADAIRVSIRQ